MGSTSKIELRLMQSRKVNFYELAAPVLRQWLIFLICNPTELGAAHITELMGDELL
jgi:hypothetical protein